MVTSPEFCHVPTSTLARLAQRLGRVFASPSTWHKLGKTFKWRRPRLRIHPAKPKIGLRASRPNELWHIDTTVVRLLDGTKAYVQAVIDNFSRRILAWRVSASIMTISTVEILVEAARSIRDSNDPPKVVTDSGTENVNGDFETLINSGRLRRVLAQIDITFSNSMIEAWWRSLKHQWLYLNTLDTIGTLRRLVAFYVSEHNTKLPHSAFQGQTPDEMHFGTDIDVVKELRCQRAAARARRFEVNRELRCPVCEDTETEVTAT
ncbi:MAG: DDE-type integrase/transposase/recombinase [Planctomycetota bacterium]